MKTVNVHEAKTNLSQLLSEVEQGAEVVIARNGTPVARLTALAPARRRREPGILSEWGPVDLSIFAPMTDEEMAEEGWP